MKKMILTFLVLALVIGLGYSQEETDVKKEEKKTIIIKTVDEDGNVSTEIIDGDEADLDGAKVWVTEVGDSIKVEVEVEDDGNTKKIRKRIEMKDIEDLEDLIEFEKENEIYRFDDELAPPPRHRFWMEKFGGPNESRHGYAYLFNDEPDKARLGVMIEDDDKGVKVTEVVENSSAWSVGILAGDVITQVDGKKMNNVEELQRAITDHEVGDMVDIKLKRNGKNERFTARLQGANEPRFEFRMPPQFQDGMKRMKHHFYRGIDDFENNHRFDCKGMKNKDCDRKCTGDHKHDCKKEIIIDKELQLKDKKKQLEEHKMQLEEKMEQMEEERAKELEMQKEKEILEREIEKSQED